MQRFSKSQKSFFDHTVFQKELLILKVLGNRYCSTILEVVYNKPKPCVEITAETGIPISTVYRKVQNMHDLGLLQISGSISNEGKKYFLYKSKVKSIEGKFDGKISVEIKLK